MSSNRQIVADAFAAWSARTGDVTSIFAPHMRWEIVGEVVEGTALYDSIAFNELWETVRPGGQQAPLVLSQV
jgi:hypothetical protein